MALCLELLQVVHHLAAEEGAAVFEGWLINDYLCTLCLDALHDALDGTLAEVVGVRLHREAVDSYYAVVLLARVKAVVISMVVGASSAEDFLVCLRNEGNLK